MAQSNRPLSPHLDIYRWEISNTLSILHRMTGVMLSLGGLVLVGWLVSVVTGPEAYAQVTAALDSLPGQLMLIGWSCCFFYHLANGVRHLFWDIGAGFEKTTARRSGWAVVILSTLMTLAFWLLALQVVSI
jgi:succinate dehydrogenase / fumarate reductase cytochrome b subunit